MWPAPFLFVFAALLSSSMLRPELHAQESRVGAEIWGRVHQAGDTLGLPGALVEIVGAGMSSAANRAGIYRLVGLRPGPHVLRVRLLGFRSVTLEVDLQDSQPLHRNIPLERMSVSLPEVRIEGQLRRVPPRFEDVYRRMSTANGTFFTREDIELLNPPDVQGLLMRVSTVRVNGHGIQFAKCDAGGAYALVRGGGWENAGVQIYIDGYRVTGRVSIERSGRIGGDEQREVLSRVNPSQIQAIEVYSGTSRIPGEFLEDACAVIAIWTRSY